MRIFKMQTKLKKAMENLRKEFTKETGISVKAIRQDYPGQKPYEDGFCDDYVLWLESRITEKRKEVNEIDAANTKMHNQLQSGRDYLMQLENINIRTVAGDILEAFGFGRNGLDY